MKTKLPFSLVAGICMSGNCFSQGTLQFNFDGPPVIASGTAQLVESYSESGMLFTPIITPDTRFVRVGGNPEGGRPDNGSGYLQAGFTSTLMFSFTDGSSFNMVAVDLAEYSTLYQEPLMVRFVGYRLDGSTVAADFTTDGIIDGTGPLADFQTFYFGPEFSNLIRVEIPTPLWSLDNLVVAVPEPSSLALVLCGGALWLTAQRGRAVKRTVSAIGKGG